MSDAPGVPNGVRARLAARPPGEAPGRVIPAGRRASDAALELAREPLLIVSREGVLLVANRAARALLGLAPETIGTPFGDLAVSSRPADLAAAVEQAVLTRRPMAVEETAVTAASGEAHRLDVSVTPLQAGGGPPLGAAIVFHDPGRRPAGAEHPEGGRRDVDVAYEKLASALGALAITSELLRSANEELQSTDEELRSANEELETIDDELRDRTNELSAASGLLDALVGGLDVGLAVVDRDRRVLVWNDRAEEVWGVSAAQAVEQDLFAPDLGLPAEQLAPALDGVIGGSSERVQLALDAVDRGGRAVSCRTTVIPLVAARDREPSGVRGAILLMQVAPPAAGR